MTDRLVTVPFLFIALLTLSAAPSPTWEEAGAAYQKGDWKTAAAEYGAITKRELATAMLWLRHRMSAT